MILFERRGSRLEGNKVKVRVTKNGQFSLTLPRALALGYGLRHGSVVVFEPQKQGGLKITKFEEPVREEEAPPLLGESLPSNPSNKEKGKQSDI